MNCNELDNYLHEFLDDQLAGNKRDEVANHLASCRRCAIKVAELEQADRELRSLESVEPPPDFLLAVRRKIEQQEASLVRNEYAPGELFWETLARRLSWLALPIGAAAAVALVFAMVTLVQSSRRVEQYEFARNDRPPVQDFEHLDKALPRNVEGTETTKEERRIPVQPRTALPAEIPGPVLTNSLSTGDTFFGVQSPVPPVERASGPILLENAPPTEGTIKVPDKSETAAMVAKQAVAAPSSAKKASSPVLPTTNYAAAPATMTPLPAAGREVHKSMEPLASIGPTPTNVPWGLQSGWLDLATRNFYLQIDKGAKGAGFVRGYLDEKGKFKLISAQVEGEIVEADARQVASKGTPGWLTLSTLDFVPARPGLKPSFPYVEGYQDKQGDFHATSRHIYKASD